MKGLFVFARAVEEGKLPPTETFEFQPMNYGPCSLIVYEALDALIKQGFVKAEEVSGESWKRFAITAAGEQEAKKLARDKANDYIRRVRAWCDAQSFAGLLRAIYQAYPKYAVNSILPHLRPNK